MTGGLSLTASLPDNQFATSPGTYVEGRLTCIEGSADLILKQKGHEDRVVLTAAQDEHSFRFVAGADRVTLCIRKDAAAKAELQIIRMVAPEDQGAGNLGELCSAPQSPRLKSVARGDLAADEFWQQIVEQGTPMVELDPQGNPNWHLLTFLWRGNVRNVRLIGAPAQDHVWMKRLAGTEIWFASFRVPKDLRLSYRIAPDVPDINASARENRLALLAVARSDPLNKTPLFTHSNDPFAQWSEVHLDGKPRSVNQILGPVAHDVVAHRVADLTLSSGRKIWVHRTPGFVPGAAGNVLLLVFDGEIYLQKLDLPGRIEEQAQSGALPSIATVFIDAVSPRRRSEDLVCDQRFTQWLVDEVLRFASKWIGQRFDARQVVAAGSSFGGLASAFASLGHPKQVGNFIALSGSFWWQPSGANDSAPYLASLTVDPNLRAVLSAGCYETARHEGDIGILESTRSFLDHLKRQGVQAQMRTYTGGHDYAVWAPALIDALRSLFGPSLVARQTRS